MHSIVEISHKFLEPVLHRQALCVDATLGRGKDTRFFLNQGVRQVVAFEIQEDVLTQTVKNIEDTRLQAYACGHEHMEDFIFQPVDAIIFNFGYCPGSDRVITTKAQTSLRAVKTGLSILKQKGRMALVLYPHPEGVLEAEVIENLVQSLDNKAYTVIQYKQLNKANAPYLIGIEKKEGIHV